MAVAMAVGAADFRVGIGAAAQAFSLVFRPLVKEDHCLVCLKEALNTPTKAPPALTSRGAASARDRAGISVFHQ